MLENILNTSLKLHIQYVRKSLVLKSKCIQNLTTSLLPLVQATINLFSKFSNRLLTSLFPSLPIYSLFLTQHSERPCQSSLFQGWQGSSAILHLTPSQELQFLLFYSQRRKGRSPAKASLRRWPESCAHQFFSYAIGQDLVIWSQLAPRGIRKHSPLLDDNETS